MNRGDRFEARALPSAAQTSSAFGVVVGDWNGDGWEDLFLAQNFFAVEPGQVSGVKIYGQQRGAAAADFDQDGRLDLVVGQNGAATKLLRNQQGSPGLRVRLIAGETNPNGIGSILRLGNEKQLGPARVVTAGSGYCSQDSVIKVMTFEGESSRLEVQWPDGKVKQYQLPPGGKEVRIEQDSGMVSAGTYPGKL